jgi:hypothetical protein
MTLEWSLTYDYLGAEQAEQSVDDESSLELILHRLDGVEALRCQLTNWTDGNYMLCRGGPDEFVVVYAGVPPGFHWSPGFVRERIFILGRKNDANSHILRVRWQANPVVFVDVRAHSVLTLPEVITIFKTFFTTVTVHKDFATILKPSNGYVT